MAPELRERREIGTLHFALSSPLGLEARLVTIWRQLTLATSLNLDALQQSLIPYDIYEGLGIPCRGVWTLCSSTPVLGTKLICRGAVLGDVVGDRKTISDMLGSKIISAVCQQSAQFSAPGHRLPPGHFERVLRCAFLGRETVRLGGACWHNRSPQDSLLRISRSSTRPVPALNRKISIKAGCVFKAGFLSALCGLKQGLAL